MTQRRPSTSRVIEFIAVLMLGLATVGTAWCAYQASEWNGRQTDLARESAVHRIDGNRLFGLTTQKMNLDATTVTAYAQAVADGNTRLAEFYRTTLVRPAMRPMLDKWAAMVRAGQTPPNPLEDPAYLESQFAGYSAEIARADAVAVEGEKAGEVAHDYTITTILLAVALFFAGVQSSFSLRPVRVLLVLLSGGAIAVAAVTLVTLPTA